MNQDFNNLQNNTNIYNNELINNNNSFSNHKKNNNNIFIMIGGGVILGIIIVVCIFIFGGKHNTLNDNNYTAEMNEILTIKEMEGVYNFDIEVLSRKKDYNFNSWFYSGNCYALEINIKNNSTSDLNFLSLVHFTLIDSNGNEIAGSNMSLNHDIDGSINSVIKSGQSDRGYLFFYNIDNDGNTSNIDSSDINKLEIKVPEELQNNDGVIQGNYREYYINLK